VALYAGNDPPPRFGSMSDYLARLNPEQRLAVETLDGPLLVLAGAGTGKTRVLTTRFAHILLTKRAWPSQVLAVTFTNKAAREMRERVAAMLGTPVEGLWLGTFHALGARMLRRHAALAGLQPGFTILDTDDQLRLLKPLMQEAGLDLHRFPPPVLMGQIQRWKDRGLTPARITPAEDTDFAQGKARALYAAYQERLAAVNAVDFGDLLLHTTELLRTHSDVLAAYHRNLRYILVDEYQDTNLVQYLWLRLLAQEHRNICCVGDDDQSIYSWRGAEVENILRFEQDFPGAQVVRLEANYRSTAPILAAAASLIAHNEGRLGKTLRAGRAESDGEKVVVLGLRDSDEEARTVGLRIEALRSEGHSLAEIAILVRASFQTRAFEERLIAWAIPYRVVGGLRFYERAEIRDAIAYLRATLRPGDDLAFERILNVPRRGLGAAALRKLHERARANGIPLAAAAEALNEAGSLSGRVRESLSALLAGFARWRAVLERDGPVVSLRTILDESGYLEMLEKDRSPEAPGRIENLRELGRAMAEFETLEGFLDHVSLVMENDENAAGDRVSLMTLHAAKGLEFDTVFLPGWEEGLFPHQRALEEAGTKALEEERRLAYVGLTRARTRAIVSHVAFRRFYSGWQNAFPSRFLAELPEEAITRSGAALLEREAALTAAPVFSAVFPSAVRFPRVRDVPVEPQGKPRQQGRNAPIAVGARVFHQKFGYGTVTGADEDRLDIEFEKEGRKRVLDRFVDPA